MKILISLYYTVIFANKHAQNIFIKGIHKECCMWVEKDKQKTKTKIKIFKLFKIQTVPLKKKKKKIMKDNGWKKQGRILVLESTVYCRYIFM